ncbi:hypothetical protein ACFE04_000429 [Oxalis oulophora]
MGIRLPSIIHNAAKQILKRQQSSSDVPKGHVVVYVGEVDRYQKKRFVVPISCLNHPSFMCLLRLAEEEFGYNHPMGGITIPCKESAFIDLMITSSHVLH